MKRIVSATLFTAALATALIACNNGDYSANPQGSVPPPGGVTASDCAPSGKEPLSAFIDDVEFVADAGSSTMAMIYDTAGVGGSKWLYITADNANFNGGHYWMTMLIGNYKGPGAYYFYNGGAGNLATFAEFGKTDGMFSTAFGGNGVIHVYRDDDTVAGDFYVMPKNGGGSGKKVCGGRFKMKKM